MTSSAFAFVSQIHKCSLNGKALFAPITMCAESDRAPARRSKGKGYGSPQKKKSRKPVVQQIQPVQAIFAMDYLSETYKLSEHSKAGYLKLSKDLVKGSVPTKVIVEPVKDSYGRLSINFFKRNMDDPLGQYVPEDKVSVITVDYIDVREAMGYINYILNDLLVPLAVQGIFWKRGAVHRIIRDVCYLNESGLAALKEQLAHFMSSKDIFKELSDSKWPKVTEDQDGKPVFVPGHPLARFQALKDGCVGFGLITRIAQQVKLGHILNKSSDVITLFDGFGIVLDRMVARDQPYSKGGTDVSNKQLKEISLTVNTILKEIRSGSGTTSPGKEISSAILIQIETAKNLINSQVLVGLETASSDSLADCKVRCQEAIAILAYAQKILTDGVPTTPEVIDAEEDSGSQVPPH
jgi:hypothetical protein